jgi:nucleotide-binding universal stress UspA family protein
VPATIIAAVDNSPASLQAARVLADYRGERERLAVVALNVQARPLTLWPRMAIDPDNLDEALLAEGRRSLEPACTLLAAAGLPVERVVRLGIPAQCIAEEAIRRGAAMIAIGTRGEGPLGGFALGSVALRVAHRAQAATMLVQPDTRLPDALGRGVRALVPLDGSSHAFRAVSFLLSSQDWLGQLHVDLVHVRPAPTVWEALLPAEPAPEEWGSLEAERATRDARAALHAAATSYQLHEATGETAAQIVRLAGVLSSELIVMGTRGLGAVHHALIGSVAMKVALASAVPVVLVGEQGA